MADRIVRHSIGLIFWMVFAAGLIWIGIMSMIANYLGCKAAFELLRFEMRPLGSDELVGDILGAFFRIFDKPVIT